MMEDEIRSQLDDVLVELSAARKQIRELKARVRVLMPEESRLRQELWNVMKESG